MGCSFLHAQLLLQLIMLSLSLSVAAERPGEFFLCVYAAREE
jgi:hypothetical protein